MEDKISLEVAENQVQELFDYYDIDVDDIDDEDQKSNLFTARKKAIRAVQQGRLIIEEKEGSLKVTQVLSKPPGDIDRLEYREIDGKSKIGLKNKKKNDGFGRIYTLLGSLAGLSETAIAALKGKDMGLAESLGLIFLQA